MDSTFELIQRYQEEGDQEALYILLLTYLPLIEKLVDKFDKSALGREVVLEKARERFSFIIGKYQLSVQMPIETFLTNTYRNYLRTL